MPDPKRVVSFRMAPEHSASLRAMAKKRGMSQGELIEQWIRMRVQLDKDLKAKEQAGVAQPPLNGGAA